MRTLLAAAPVVAALAGLHLSPAAQTRTDTYLRVARWLDPASGAIQGPSVIQISNGTIANITPADRVDKSVASRARDLGNVTMLPGLVDAHVHLQIGGSVADNAAAVLNAGFTTVVDLGATNDEVLRFRDSVASGAARGPRILAAGLWAGVKDGICEFGGIGVSGGAAGFRARVRENVRAGADLIKVCVSTWLADAYTKPEAYEIDDASLAAAVDESHKAKRIVVAHAIGLGAVKASLRAGVNGFAHAAFLDEATAAEMKKRDAFMIPTLASLVAERTGPAAVKLRESVAMAAKAGVTLVFGTDGGVLPHGQNAKEFQAMAAAGIAPIETIRAATVNAARVFNLGKTGRIEPGAPADLIAVEGDPLVDLTALSRMAFVMRGGRIVRP